MFIFYNEPLCLCLYYSIIGMKCKEILFFSFINKREPTVRPTLCCSVNICHFSIKGALRSMSPAALGVGKHRVNNPSASSPHSR